MPLCSRRLSIEKRWVAVVPLKSGMTTLPLILVSTGSVPGHEQVNLLVPRPHYRRQQVPVGSDAVGGPRGSLSCTVYSSASVAVFLSIIA